MISMFENSGFDYTSGQRGTLGEFTGGFKTGFFKNLIKGVIKDKDGVLKVYEYLVMAVPEANEDVPSYRMYSFVVNDLNKTLDDEEFA